MSVLKQILKFIMIVFTILFVVISVFFLTFDLNTYRGVITSKISEVLGRPVIIEDMSMKISLVPTVEVKGLQIPNTQDFHGESKLLDVDSMDVTLNLLPLLHGEIEVASFNMATASVTLIEEKGTNNYTFMPNDMSVDNVPNTQKSSDHILNKLKVGNIAIKTLAITYITPEKKQELSFMDVNIQQLKVAKMSVLYNGRKIDITAYLGDFVKLFTHQPNYSFSGEISAFDAILKITGNIGDTETLSDMTLNVSAQGKNLQQVVAGIYKQMPQVPVLPFQMDAVLTGGISALVISPIQMKLGEDHARFEGQVGLSDLKGKMTVAAKGYLDVSDRNIMNVFGLKPASVSFDILTDFDALSVQQVVLNAGKSDVKLAAQIKLDSNVPMINAQAVSQYLDIYDFLDDTRIETEMPSQKTEQHQPLFSNEKMDFSVLKSIDAKIEFLAEKLKLFDADYIGLKVDARLEKGKLDVPNVVASSTLGKITGNGVLDAENMPAKMVLNLKSDGLNLNDIKAMNEHMVDSEIILDVQLKTQGDSVQSFVNDLNGKVVVELTKGIIVNKWFNSLPLIQDVLKTKSNAVSFSTTDQVTDLVCGAVNLTIKDGQIISNEQIALETSVINLMVNGDINLPAEELSLTMVPSLATTSKKAQNILSLTQMVKISGPFHNLTPSLDAQGMASAGVGLLINKAMDNPSVIKPQYSMCQHVLGRSVSKKDENIVMENRPEDNKAQQPSEPMDTKEQFKQQLMESLSKALKK